MGHRATIGIRVATLAALLPVLPACESARVSTLTQSTWCDGFEHERLTPAVRMTGRNRERLEAAQRLVAPGLGPTRAVSGLSLLGGYQEEMGRARPDLATAATYLATASAVPLTTELVAQVNGFLCVTTTARRASDIAVTATATLREMIGESRT
jgi:hypothetical protein